MKLIVCVDEQWGIGSQGDLLYHIPADLKFFKESTTGHQIIMGKATFLSLPGKRPLPNRNNIILTSDRSFSVDGANVVHTIEEALNLSKKGETFIIGGESIYQQFLPYCDTAFVTKVFSRKHADRTMVNLDEHTEWKKVDESEVFEYRDLKYRFQTYTKQM